MKKLGAKEFLDLFSPHLLQEILNTLRQYPDAIGVVCFENQNMWSSRFGDRAALVVGPSNTYKSPEACEGKWLNDLPSQRQYPTAWASAEDLLRGK